MAHALKSLFIATVLLSALDAGAWKVFMAGDSHVCSKIYPRTVERILEAEEPDIHFSYYGKIGAGFYTYDDSPEMMNEIYKASPDILIVHLGTNDSFTRNFRRSEFLKNVTIFYDGVAQRLPECKIVFVTPFYNKLKGSKTPNKNTRRCADALLDFVANHKNTFVVDNNATYGMHFLDNRARLMRRDCVHLTEEGYEELGNEVGDAIAAMEHLWLIFEPELP